MSTADAELAARYHTTARRASAMWRHMGALNNRDLSTTAAACAALFEPFMDTWLEPYALFDQATYFACGARYTVGDRVPLIEAAEQALVRLAASPQPPVAAHRNRGIPHLEQMLADARRLAEGRALGD